MLTKSILRNYRAHLSFSYRIGLFYGVTALSALSGIRRYSSPGTQEIQNICITFIQRRSNVFDVDPTLSLCYTNILCLLGIRSVCLALYQCWISVGPTIVKRLVKISWLLSEVTNCEIGIMIISSERGNDLYIGQTGSQRTRSDVLL